MRYQWRNSLIGTVVLVGLAAIPSLTWPKGDSAEQLARLDHSGARGIVKAAAQAVLYASVQGRVSHLPYKEGQRFEKGHTLVQLDCDKYHAELAVAVAEHQGKDKVFKNNQELAKLNSVSKVDLEISEADAKKAWAAIRVAEVNVKGCLIIAPFGGRVVSLMTNEHETVFPNDKLISLLDDSSLEIELVLPSSSLAWLKRKAAFTFVVDETRKSYPARVKEIGASVDPASQTIKVTGTFEKLPPEVLAGMSGTARFVEQP